MLDWQVLAAGQIFAPRQLLSYKDVTNAENAGAFFCPASPKAPNVGALIHAIHGVMQNLHSYHPWQSVTAVKPTRMVSRRPAKRVTVPSTTLIVPGCYTFRTSNFGIVGGGLGVLGKGFASMERA
ncbi:hypothetical protein [Methylotuvimicrobium sp. KM1]|uniref:hypothetical protein n=1 Tax=Methylotuvimicrobium sp. KM1 TaxID=3377707 RepID=UPI00384DF71E